MNCPICKTVVAKLPEQLHGRHCKCPKDEHVGLLLELFETLEHRADKLNDARRMLELREQQLANALTLRGVFDVRCSELTEKIAAIKAGKHAKKKAPLNYRRTKL